MIKGIIFDFGRVLFDSETKKEFSESEEIVSYCKEKGYKLALVSLVSPLANATLSERKNQIESSNVYKYLEFVEVTDQDKDKSFDEVVQKMNLPRDQILIVDDRTVRGIKYGNKNGHPTVWLQKGTFANELPNLETGAPTYIIKLLQELKNIV
ncbi:MAG: HAD hydrolase-like protein [Candidatus Paceibacterota bacterium]